MRKVYSYRLEMRVKDPRPMREYDERYQFTPEGKGIAWCVGIAWPAIEDGLMGRVPNSFAIHAAAAADRLIATVMLNVRAEWEKRHG
jgi:hypothetical protein